ncbi:hypothetical protein Y032_0295g1666 [Ancylostoma ceylanicum]|uniref:Uncharacterized protein n=1 Tax=Ancylostoma ceylanicum TaxID=53326 RepID=A0A016S5K9_9BILA|nr:hypothetical protein Y032_0295g1666 [Ancylostoma ceylanicum]
MLRSSNLGAEFAINYRSRSTVKYRSRFFRNGQKSSNFQRNFPVERREGFGDSISCQASNCWMAAQGIFKDSSRQHKSLHKF